MRLLTILVVSSREGVSGSNSPFCRPPYGQSMSPIEAAPYIRLHDKTKSVVLLNTVLLALCPRTEHHAEHVQAVQYLGTSFLCSSYS